MPRSLLLLALLCCCAGLHAASAGLDGRQFAIELVEAAGGKAAGKDVLVFAAGFGDCQAAGSKYGYAKGMCAVVGRGKELSFRFVMSSPEHGELLFEGVVAGQAVHGTRIWSKPGKPPIVHRFTGQQP